MLPAIPEPQTSDLPTLLDACEAVVAWADTCDDLAVVRDVYDRFAAVAEYLTRLDAAREASATMRRLEVRIGQLLPPPAGQGARTDLAPTSPHAAKSGLSHQRADEFRAMAAHPGLVDAVIEESTQRSPASRRQVLAKIAEQKLDDVKDAIRADAEKDRAEDRAWRDSIPKPPDFDPAAERRRMETSQAVFDCCEELAGLGTPADVATIVASFRDHTVGETLEMAIGAIGWLDEFVSELKGA